MSHRVSRRRFLGYSVPLASVGLALSEGCSSGAPHPVSSNEGPFDLLIRGGTVVDGAGGARFAADVAIKDGRIVEVGSIGDAAAKSKLDATGKIVSPGFIDMHSHSDSTLLVDGLAQSAVRQGITTLVNGNCGGTPAPASESATSDSETFATFEQYLSALRSSGISANVCALVGHNTVRRAVMGVERRDPTDSELGEMKKLVAEAMRSGAVGMSTGLISAPGAYSRTPELIELAKTVAQIGGLYSTHMRGEASTLVESVAEALRIGAEAGVPVEISHHKAVGKENWGTTARTLRMIEKANQEGATVRVDVYPYIAGSGLLSQFVAPWAHEGGSQAMLKRLRDPEGRGRVKHDMIHGSPDWQNFFAIDWEDIQIARVKTPENQKWVGRRVADVARARNVSGYDACIDLILEEEDFVRMINFVIDEEEMRSVLKHPLAMVGSDGRAVSPESWKANPHPRYYGCFPRVLGHYCRGVGLFDLETAVHKMTGMPAAQLGLRDRGVLRKGNAADVTVFDYESIIDKATFEDANQYPEGITAVIVNGEPVFRAGGHTGNKPGTVLPPQRG